MSMSELEKFLLSPDSSTVDEAELRYLSKKAARKYVTDKVPLRETISGMVKEASLNNEQVKRLVEMSNIQTFIDKFEERGYSKNVDFDIVGADEIGDKQVPMEKAASIQAPSVDQDNIPYLTLEAVFGNPEPEMEKVASDQWSKEDEDKYLNRRYEITNAASDLRVLADMATLEMSNLKGLVKHAKINEEVNPAEINALLSHVGMHAELVKEASLNDDSVGTIDTTGMTVDKTHPLYEAALRTKQAMNVLLSQKAYLENLASSYDGKRQDDITDWAAEAYINAIE